MMNSPLRDYCKALGVKYFYESRAVIALAKKKLKNGSICSWCSRMKRGILYSTMRREKYNVLVPAGKACDVGAGAASGRSGGVVPDVGVPQRRAAHHEGLLSEQGGGHPRDPALRVCARKAAARVRQVHEFAHHR